MAILKCKMCGGNVIYNENEKIGTCDSCGTKQTIASVNDEKKLNLLDRANHFRMENEFDKAMSIYEQLLSEDTTDSEIYWSLVLCRYGITYVEDPRTKRRIPTINRMQNKAILKDADYLMTIEKANDKQKQLYIDEANYIDKVQKRILDIIKQEEPYDIFICYKETDDNGERTKDSVLATDLYYGLTNEGYKVFFSRITLEGKLGEAYEPYIFAALNSSKIMVVLGSKKEYFEAVWVRNEWYRYITLIKEGENKKLIPAYKDMDPYDLPEEFINLQALDMGKIGFLQDLIRGIKKIVNKDKKNNESEINEKKRNFSENTIDSLIKRINAYLEDEDYNNANLYCEKALDIDAENVEIYIYKLLIEAKAKNLDELKNKNFNLSLHYKNYNKILKYDNGKYLKTLEDINKESMYNCFLELVTYGYYKQAMALYKNKFIGYKDSEEKIIECMFKVAENYTEVEEFLLPEIEKFSTSENLNILQKYIYNFAIKLYQESNVNSKKNAIILFEKIKDYENSSEWIYQYAITKYKNKLYDEAKILFEKIKTYKDSEEKINDIVNVEEKKENRIKIFLSVATVLIIVIIIWCVAISVPK